jgi:hypothetical protein
MNLGQTAAGQGQPIMFTWTSSAGATTLTGSTLGNNVFVADSGNDTLKGAGQNNTYEFGSTFGQSTISNNPSGANSSPEGAILFGPGISTNQLWFQQSGNNLQIDLLGTNDSVTVDNWYSGNTGNQVQTIETSDGSKLDTQIQQLVSAMATYSANNPGFNPTQASQMPNDQGLQNAAASAWHH